MEKQRSIVIGLLERSQAGKIPWEESVRPRAYQVSFTNYSVVIWYEDRPDDELDIHIDIINSSGDIVESFSDMQLTERFGPGPYKQMKDLYELARRTALGSEAALDEILEALLRNRAD